MVQDTGVSSPPLTSRELPSWLPGPYCSLKTQLKHTPLTWRPGLVVDLSCQVLAL